MEPHERLKAARIKAGFPTAAAAARRFGWEAVTLRHHEAGINGIRPDVAEQYAKAFHVTASWLLYGDGEEPPAPQEAEIINLLRRLPERKRETLLNVARDMIDEDKKA